MENKINRIFITGDVHGDINISKLNTTNFTEQKHLDRDDCLIITGDFGCPWSYPESKTDKHWLKWHNDKPYTTLFVDGNHENFDALEKYPIVTFKGARCHQIRENVYHVMRGEILEIGDHKIWCMGGADSHDKQYRTEFLSWWHQEEPNYDELTLAHQTLMLNKPDIMITHEGPLDIIKELYYTQTVDSSVARELNNMLWQAIENKNDVQWFFGHHHIEHEWQKSNVKLQCLYNSVVEI